MPWPDDPDLSPRESMTRRGRWALIAWRLALAAGAVLLVLAAITGGGLAR